MAEDVPKNMNDDIEDEDEDEEKELTLFDQIRDALPAGVTTNAVFIYIFRQRTVPENIPCKASLSEGYWISSLNHSSLEWALVVKLL